MANRILAAVMFALSSIYIYASFQIPPSNISDPVGARVFPIIIGVAGLITAIYLAISSISFKPDAIKERLQFQQHHTMAVIAVLAWMFAYDYAFERLGFLIASIVFLLGLTAWFNRKHWLMNICVSFGFPIFIYFVLTDALDVTLPKGPLPF